MAAACSQDLQLDLEDKMGFWSHCPTAVTTWGSSRLSDFEGRFHC